jgi:hypothetical protein
MAEEAAEKHFSGAPLRYAHACGSKEVLFQEHLRHDSSRALI